MAISKASEAKSQSLQLRIDLKEWEKSFAAAHKGRKATRDDIKEHPEIVHKYKIYNTLREYLDKPNAATPSKKRAHSTTYAQSELTDQTTLKRPKHAHNLNPAAIDPYDPPTSSLLSPTHFRTSIGPTPQKNGKVLGLFDLLSSESTSKTPSKRQALKSVGANVHATPSRRPPSQGGQEESCKKHRKSPPSASKRAHLDSILTPTARRITESRTPGSRSGVSKLRFDDTPAFLRRDSQRASIIDSNELAGEDGLSWSPISLLKLPKPAGKGLSVLVRGLREMEDEKLDDELDMLRETEGLGSNTISTQPKILVRDSQRGEMPLGPDGGGEGENEDAGLGERQGRDGKPLKVWKKKGQKRTTRMVKMRPNTAKWRPEPVWKGGGDDGDDGDEEGGEVVQETQVVYTSGREDKRGDGDELDEYEEDELNRGEDDKAVGKKRKKDKGMEEKKEGLITKVKKKISATAHANFRALKIKNKQSKSKGGRRFGRR